MSTATLTTYADPFSTDSPDFGTPEFNRRCRDRRRCFQCPHNRLGLCLLDGTRINEHAISGWCPDGRYPAPPMTEADREMRRAEDAQLSARIPRQRFTVAGLPEPSPFNGCLLPTDRGFLLAYRADNERLSACHLGPDYSAEPGTHRGLGIHRNIDPKLFRTDAGVFMLTSYYSGGDAFDDRMELWSLSRLRPTPAVGPRLAFSDGVSGDPAYVKGREKNWMPFAHGGDVYFVQGVAPHRVLRADFEHFRATLAHSSPWSHPTWRREWGTGFRGNAPPARLPDGTFLAAFHAAARPWGYYSGFYRFAGEPPFRVLSASLAPVFTPHDSTGECERNPGAGRLVFLTGLQVDGDVVRVSGGDNDHSIVVFHLSLADVLADMVGVGADPMAFPPDVPERVASSRRLLIHSTRELIGELEETRSEVE